MPRRGKGEGSIYKRKDGRWVGSITLVSGKRRDFYGATQKEVREKLTKALHDRDENRLLVGTKQTTGQYLDDWLDYSVEGHKRPRTADLYRQNVARVKPHIGSVRLDRLGADDIRRCYAALRERIAPSTLRTNHVILKAALQDAVDSRLIPWNPAAAVKPYAVPRTERPTLTREHVQSLLEYTEGDWWYALWALLATHGLRIGEAMALRWDDLDTKGSIHIRYTLRRERGGTLHFDEPKTTASRRTVPLTPFVRDALSRHRVMQLEERLKAGDEWKDHNLIFCSHLGKPLDPCGMGYSLTKALKGAGIPRVRVHDLRHTAATLMVEQDIPVQVVSAMLGHSSISTTLSLYAHVTERLQREAVEKMDTLFRRRVQ